MTDKENAHGGQPVGVGDAGEASKIDKDSIVEPAGIVKPLAPNPEYIPQELRDLCQWVTWRYELSDGKKTKIPKNPRTGGNAMSNEPQTWGTLDKALTAYQKRKHAGIGFMFSEHDPYTGIDLDHVIDPQTGTPEPWAADELRRLASYTELSPSGTGVHVFCKAIAPNCGKNGQVEIYDRTHFFAMTGAPFDGMPATIEGRQSEIDDFYRRHFPDKKTSPKAPTTPGSPSNLADGELLDKAFNAKNGTKFAALWGGSIAGYPSQSEADQALCNLLAFWTAGDPARMDSLFRRSGLYRPEKWDKPHYADGRTYGQGTIDDAIDYISEGYDPNWGKPAASSRPAAEAEPEHLTDMGNARRFAREHGANLRFTYGLGWLTWTGQCYEQDYTGAVMRLAKATVIAIFREAESAAGRAVKYIGQIAEAASNPDQVERLQAAKAKAEKTAASVLKWALQSQGRQRIEAMIVLAESEPEIAARDEEFDRNPWLLNCANGTVDLKTGELRAHDRGDLLTKCCPVAYNPAAISSTWERFLSEATAGNAELADFLWRAAGYTLCGQVFDKIVVLLLGPNDTGKSTFVEAMLSAVGRRDYGHKADIGLVLDRYNAGGPRPDLADLRGKRLVAICEASDKTSINAALLKELSGGDSITARHLYQEEITFEPQHTLWLATNKVPTMDSDDPALWDRIKRLPFEHVIPEEKRDPKIKATLCDPLDGGPSVLAWAVRGCLEWQRRGLRAPEIVKRATAELRKSMDDLAPFFDACCTFERDAQTPAAELRKAYDAWCADSGVSERRKSGGKVWGEALKKRGCEQGRPRIDGQRVSVWYGVKLTAGDTDDNGQGGHPGHMFSNTSVSSKTEFSYARVVENECPGCPGCPDEAAPLSERF
jgi:putative DNA primase/helicase